MATPVNEIAQLLTTAGLASGISIIISFIVCGLVVTLGKFWFEKKLQSRITDNESKLKKIQSELDKSTHVHRIQFEKEFKIYETIWEKLFDLKQKTLALRPIFDTVDPNQSEEDRKNERLDNFSKSFNSFLHTYAKNQPFYAQEVYDCITKISKTALHEAIDYEHAPKNKDYWNEAKKHEKELLENIEECILLIRKE